MGVYTHMDIFFKDFDGTDRDEGRQERDR